MARVWALMLSDLCQSDRFGPLLEKTGGAPTFVIILKYLLILRENMKKWGVRYLNRAKWSEIDEK